MKLKEIMINLRNKKGWSQTDLANHSGVSRVMIGKYEREDAIPSIEAAKKIAHSFGVSLDYLVGEGDIANFDNRMLERLKAIELLDPQSKSHLIALMDAFLRDTFAKRIYTG